MNCSDPEHGRLLLPYILRRLTPSEEQRFEAHLLECDACFSDLRTLSDVGAVLHRHLDPASPPPLRSLWRRRGVAIAVGLLLVLATGAAAALLCRTLWPRELLPDALVRLGRSHLEHGEVNAAARVVRRALDAAPGDPSVLRLAARVALARGEVEEALEKISRAEARLPAGPGHLRYRVLETRAAIQLRLGRSESAEADHALAAAVGVRLGEKGLEAVALRNEARVRLLRFLDRAGARELLDRAAAAAEGQSSPFPRILVLQVEMQYALVADGDYSAALAVAERIRDLYAKADPESPNARADALNTLGVAREAMAAAGIDRAANLARAKELFTDALELRRQAKNLQGISWAKTNLGRVALLEGDLEAADRWLSDSGQIKRYLGDTEGAASTLANLALVRVLQKRPEEALGILKPVLQTAARTRDIFLLREAGLVRGRALLALRRREEGRAAVTTALDEGRRIWPTPVSRRLAEESAPLLASPPAPHATGTSILPVAASLY